MNSRKGESLRRCVRECFEKSKFVGFVIAIIVFVFTVMMGVAFLPQNDGGWTLVLVFLVIAPVLSIIIGTFVVLIGGVLGGILLYRITGNQECVKSVGGKD